ncbi:MAG: Fic family protein [Halieaceae bacterium]|jgi:hypothetical protein|nr:Fic family protein [Halieaceae bacterium]
MKSSNLNQHSRRVTGFHGFPLLETGATYAGYAALIAEYALAVPPPGYLCAIGTKHQAREVGRWRLYTPRHRPEASLKGQLIFALKYEGIDLAVLAALFQQIQPEDVADIVTAEPTGSYSRRLWFLYEWLTDTQLELEDAARGNFVPVLNEKLQYGASPRDSKRHRVRNNLPGTRDFCPLIRRTARLDDFIAMNLSSIAARHIGKTHSDLLSRAAAFLLLKDSKASYNIEGESPSHHRVERWSKIIGEAGQRDLSVDELEYLQSIVISDHRFTLLGLRSVGGFVGDHERDTGIPLPVHISARAEDLETLLRGLMETAQLLTKSEFDPVLAATLIAFGFVFIHPFEDGNGRIHRYLIHHVLAEKGFVPKGIVFPVSAVILERIDDYRRALEHYSKARLALIDWRPTNQGNVEVLNDTKNLYRYFDATHQAEFLFECVAETVNTTLPKEVDYLERYDRLRQFIQHHIDMPDRMVDLLIRFMQQNAGRISSRARQKEFVALTDNEAAAIEAEYAEVFPETE